MKIEHRLPFFYFSISKKIKIWTQIFIFELSEKMNNRNIFPIQMQMQRMEINGVATCSFMR